MADRADKRSLPTWVTRFKGLFEIFSFFFLVLVAVYCVKNFGKSYIDQLMIKCANHNAEQIVAAVTKRGKALTIWDEFYPITKGCLESNLGQRMVTSLTSLPIFFLVSGRWYCSDGRWNLRTSERQQLLRIDGRGRI